MENLWSHARHTKQERALSETSDLPSCYTRPNSVDAWRHRRMLDCTLSLVKELPDAQWLTVGDGKFGSDAFFLQTHGVDVIATSISTYTLEIAHSRGYIRKYAAENAEGMSLADDSVDFVLCKEAFHHFPRPALGLYEMLRIARKAVILIEPVEGGVRPLASLKTLIKRLVRHDVSDQFESSGNFIYRLNIRETFKMLAALGYPCMAWKPINDFWYLPFAAADYKFSFGALGTRAGIAVQNLFCQLGFLNYGLAAVICFKEPPARSLRAELRENCFVVTDLPENPYSDRAGKCAN
jgi:ubiquinone/menaquinone biosynthesis C-methylase UbiE